MTEGEIDELLAGFVRAAVRARRSGFDGIELFAAYHAVIDQAGVAHHLIGDCVAARRASVAIYEGRRLGLTL